MKERKEYLFDLEVGVLYRFIGSYVPGIGSIDNLIPEMRTNSMIVMMAVDRKKADEEGIPNKLQTPYNEGFLRSRLVTSS